MKKEITARRRRIAEEIGDALSELGLTKKEFAARMGRQPSEVTRWMSGNHNFTSDLLEEMSIVLGRPISGAGDNVPAASAAVSGYGIASAATELLLAEPAGARDAAAADRRKASAAGAAVAERQTAVVYMDRIQLPMAAYSRLSTAARENGETLREYVQEILCEKAKESRPSIFDFCGIMGEDFPDADEIRSYRTSNTYPEL